MNRPRAAIENDRAAGDCYVIVNAAESEPAAGIARHGPDWFRLAGTSEAPGTALFVLDMRAAGVRRMRTRAPSWCPESKICHLSHRISDSGH